MKHDLTFQNRHARPNPNRIIRHWLIRPIQAWIDRQRTRFALRHLDAHLLEDIGLSEKDPLYPDRLRCNRKNKDWWEF